MAELRFTERNGEPGRFAWLFSGSTSEARPVFDDVLWQSAELAILPTRGSIVPGWHLVVPRRPLPNMLSMYHSRAVVPNEVAGQISAHLRVDGRQTLWFEHGAVSSRTPLGCGVDQAHLHVIVNVPFSFRTFLLASEEQSDQRWATGDFVDLADDIQADEEFYMFGIGHEAASLRRPSKPTSQFFRKIVAKLTNKIDKWDYRNNDFIDNVHATIQSWRASS